MLGRALHVIQVGRTQYAVGKAQPDLGRVFHVHLEPALAGGISPQASHLAKEPALIVKRMTEGVHHPAAQVRAGAVAFTIIFPGVPAGQVFAPMNAAGGNFADAFLLQPGFDLFQSWMKAKLKSHQRASAVVLLRSYQIFDPLQVMRYGFFHQDGAARLGSRDGHLQV